MDKDAKKDAGAVTPEQERELQALVASFETILQAVPNDRDTLEVLYNSCVKLKEWEKARAYFTTLYRGLVESDLYDEATLLLAQADANVRDHESVQAAVTEGEQFMLSSLTTKLAAESKSAGRAPPESRKLPRLAPDIQTEMNLVWDLMEAGLVSQEEYAKVVQELSEMAATPRTDTLSVLHILQAHGHRNLEAVILRMSEKAGAPVVALGSFDIPAALANVLPVELMIRRGVVVYDLIGQEALVVIMNPFDQVLRAEVARLAERVCHFFLALPSDFDGAIERITAIQTGKSEGGGSGRAAG